MLEPDEAKVSSPVLGGLAPSNGGGLLGTREDLFPKSPFLGHLGSILRRSAVLTKCI